MKFKANLILFIFAFVLMIFTSQGEAIAATAAHSPSPNLLTLDRAKEIALENSPTMAAALERVNQAREAVAQAKADRLPTLSATTGYNYSEATDNSAPDYDETQYSSQLSATQVLFDGFYRKYAQLTAQYGEEISKASLNEARNLLAWSVAQAYLNVQLAQENITIAQSDMAFNQAQETEAEAKEQAGVGSYSDLLNFKTRVNSAQYSLLSARQNFNEALNGLAALLGYKDARLPQGMTLAPLGAESENRDTTTNPLESLDTDMKALLAQRPDLVGAGIAVDQADVGISMARAGYSPTISLTGGYGTSTGDHFADTDDMGSYLSLNLNFDFFSWGAKRSQVKEALSAKREAEQNLTEARINAMAAIRTAAQKIATAQAQLTLQRENTTLIQTSRDLVEKEYKAGQASLVRLNEAQNDLVGAMGDLAIAEVSLMLAMETFDYYTGVNSNPDGE